jgi:hypothetical protein
MKHKGKNQQNIKNCEPRHNCQQGGTRKIHIEEIRLLRAAYQFWHSGDALSVEKFKCRMRTSVAGGDRG